MSKISSSHALVGIFVVVLVFSQTKKVSSCSCLAGVHIQTLVCQSDFVIKGHVVKRDPYNLEWTEPFPDDREMMMREYTVAIAMVYKDSSSSIRDTMTMVTPFESATCGVYLEVNQTYYLAGTMTNGVAHIDSCNSLLGKLSPHEERYLEDHTYVKNCDCKIEYCSDYMPCCSTPDCRKDSCTVDMDEYESEMDHWSDYTYCAKENDHCEWYLKASGAAKENIRWAFMFTHVALAFFLCFMNKF